MQLIPFLNSNPGLLNVSTFIILLCLSWLHDSAVQYVKKKQSQKTVQGIIWETSAAKETEAELCYARLHIQQTTISPGLCIQWENIVKARGEHQNI